jgi:hypothetical protein
MIRKVAVIALAAFVAYWVLTSPAGAAHFVTGVAHLLHRAGDALTRVVANLIPRR